MVFGPRTAALREAKAFGLVRTGKVSSEMLVRLREEVAKRHGAAANDGDNGMNGMAYALDTEPHWQMRSLVPAASLPSAQWQGRRSVKAQVSHCPIKSTRQLHLL